MTQFSLSEFFDPGRDDFAMLCRMVHADIARAYGVPLTPAGEAQDLLDRMRIPVARRDTR